MKTTLVRYALAVALGITAMGTGCTTPMMGGGMTANTGTANRMTSNEQDLANAVLNAINTHRANHGLGTLLLHPAGTQVAFDHCVAMQTGNFFNHVNPLTGLDPATRALNAGIVHGPAGFIDPVSGNPFVGENLYMTTDPAATGQNCVDAWIASPGHHTQLDAPLPVTGASAMPPWTHCGIGVRKSGDTSWWTAVFLRNPN